MAVIAGNWKMYMGAAQTQAFFAGLTLEERAGEERAADLPSRGLIGGRRGVPRARYPDSVGRTEHPLAGWGRLHR